MKISMGCIHLEILDLNGVTQIKDDSIKIVTHYCKNLRIIRLRQCYQLSDVSVLAISSNNTKLQELDVSRTQLGGSTGLGHHRSPCSLTLHQT